MTALYDLPKSTQGELNDLFVGDEIARGTYRTVYAHALDPTLVIKIEHAARCFCNAAEWDIWGEIRDRPEIARWFAPCVAISFSGSVLIQKRTAPLTKLPAQLPNFLCDIKPANFGRYRGRVVAHDYGNHPHFTRSFETWALWDVVPEDMNRK